jgi:hypothetical protein
MKNSELHLVGMFNQDARADAALEFVFPEDEVVTL